MEPQLLQTCLATLLQPETEVPERLTNTIATLTTGPQPQLAQGMPPVPTQLTSYDQKAIADETDGGNIASIIIGGVGLQVSS